MLLLVGTAPVPWVPQAWHKCREHMYLVAGARMMTKSVLQPRSFCSTVLAGLGSTGRAVDNPRVCWDRSFHRHRPLSGQEDSHERSSLLLLAGWWDIPHLVALMHHAAQCWRLAGRAAPCAHHFSSASCLVILNQSGQVQLPSAPAGSAPALGSILAPLQLHMH